MTGELYRVIPFLRSFPFDEYSIRMKKEGFDFSEENISPILINTLGTFGSETNVVFFYTEKGLVLMTSFYDDDVIAIGEESYKIKKLNSVRESFDAAIESDDVNMKIVAIKEGRKFIKQLGLNHLLFQPFGGVLDVIIKTMKADVPPEVVMGLKRLSVKKVVDGRLDNTAISCVKTFLNFRIHYVKIVLGIVIAAKIH